MKKKVSLLEAIIALLLLLIVLGISAIKFGLIPEVPVLSTAYLLVFWLGLRKNDWASTQDGVKEGIGVAIIPILIFILIGALIGLWIKGSIIPSIMVLGFHLVSGQFFILSVFIVCSIVGLAIGGGFTTISAVGVALFGIGASMSANPTLVAGAIISGAVFGDKMSLLSDSTSLSPAVAESELFVHIKDMMWSTIPAFIVSLILSWILGNGGSTDASKISHTVAVLQHNFIITWWAIIPIILVLIYVWRKTPAIPTLFLNIAVAVIMIFVQNPHQPFTDLASLIMKGFAAKTSDLSVGASLTHGDISSMIDTVGLIITILPLSGLLMEFNIVQTAMEPLVERLKKPGRLVTITILSGICINLFIGEQYLSVILPGHAFRRAYDRVGLAPLALNHALEDGDNVIDYLIPWGVADSFAASTLGAPVLAFIPFTPFGLLSPVFSIPSGISGVGLKWQSKAKK